ncbi:hypothetical protein [Erythrobacter sp. MTPC3]|uniref:hypothetical protein n=1 Tax=Erythrobacter sp. MTPC3 TaxID=3056564 RepID=UPI0036F1A728
MGKPKSEKSSNTNAVGTAFNRRVLLGGVALGAMVTAQPALAQGCSLPAITVNPDTSNIVINSQGGNGDDGKDRPTTLNGEFGSTAGGVNASGTHFYNGGPTQPTIVRSIGGNGGDGQDIAIAGTAGRGGNGGNGNVIAYEACGTDLYTPGNIPALVASPIPRILNLPNLTSPLTGIYVISRGGNGGDGGDGILGVANIKGGAGGKGGFGNNVSLNIFSEVLIRPAAFPVIAPGVLVQSIGGTGGDGGTASGIIDGTGGAGSRGGDGKNVTVRHFGSITTIPNFSSGLVAQSIGGSSGGGSGGAGLFYGRGGAGDSGGTSGKVTVTLEPGSSIFTNGYFSQGVVAQSIGGGGGASAGGWGLVGVGGNAGKGNTGGEIEVNVNGAVETRGGTSDGVIAQSIGGGGGVGGSSAGIVAIGGSGGTAGAARAVTVTVGQSGSIITRGNDSRGILAQSIGGGGGAAGVTAGAVAIGGNGGAAGNGGTVNVVHNGTVDTSGDRSIGILAQSIGGGGGAGGTSVGNIAIGGRGSSGGSSARAAIGALDGTAVVNTRGNSAAGVVVQSIGGGGGNGGGSISTGGSLNVNIGGAGGNGGNAGEASAVYNGLIQTTGTASDGLVVQAVGGGGGNGGLAVSTSVSALAGISVALGGSGGNGGAGGVVTANGSGLTIRTEGNDSRGLVAQSVGGGGGNGGASVAIAAVASAAPGPAVAVAIGGSGGNGGDGGVVNSTLSGLIRTQGDRSNAVTAQSIGGGGGNGGMSVTAALAGSTLAAGSVNVGIGGSGGSGGVGNAVTVDARGGLELVTFGEDSAALLAQSIGGGGGNGGVSLGLNASLAGAGAVSANVAIGGDGAVGGNSGAVTVRYAGDAAALGNRSAAIAAQSIGGGGGNGGFSGGLSLALAGGGAVAATVNIGGSGAGGGDAGNVAVESNVGGSGQLFTAGNDSAALLAQSIGGGGGNGGSTLTLTGSAGAGGSAGVGVGIGGDAAQGGKGGAVFVNSNSRLQTVGDRSGAIVAQSIGGGGGNGGSSTSVTATLSGGASVSAGVNLGGTGGAGGRGGNVTTIQTGDIRTAGHDSSGIAAQSIAGGGGIGGTAVSIGAAGSAGAGVSVNVALGGIGGSGGTGGRVLVDHEGFISTSGDRSKGILAQSIGGSGGAGGSSVAVGVGVGLQGAGVAATVALGGAGADGGTAQSARVESDGEILTGGDDAAGILAQSIGGAGGAGGFSFAGSLAGGSGAGIAPAVAIGADGGAGAVSGNAEIIHTGLVTTVGDRSSGVLAQSIGGSGGAGGFSGSLSIGAGAAGVGLGVTLGGAGGSGGDSAIAVAQQIGAVSTLGADAIGIGAQSIGGSGGAGGNSISLGAAVGVGAAAVNVSLGGNGGAGGTSGAASVFARDGVQTAGARSHAILAQSIGGSGGAGGFSVAMSLAGGKAAGGVSVGIGGSGGDGGTSAAVNVDNIGSLLTTGTDSNGILAQSIGGSGGAGGFALTGAGGIGATGGIAASVSVAGTGGLGGEADTVTITSEGDIQTGGDRARGVAAQSIGGDGGVGGWSGAFAIAGGGVAGVGVSVGIGGIGGDGGISKDVTIASTGNVMTLGAYAQGLLAQSIGGGGGAGGFALGASVGIGGKAGVGAAVTLGGAGGNGADSGIARISAIGDIATEGAGSTGILAQSIGGNGGAGGFSFAAGAGAGGTVGAGAAVSIGGSGGAGGTATLVDIDHVGDILTIGADAGGIVGQSIGGNGGAGGFSVAGALTAGQNAAAASVTIGGAGGLGGTSAVFDFRDVSDPRGNIVNPNVAVVDIANLGGIITTGDRSSGIVAQSIGGSGGSGGTSVGVAVNTATSNAASIAVSIGGAGGDGGRSSGVAVTQTGDIATLGHDSYGIVAQSVGGDGGTGGGSVGVAIGAAGQTQVSGAITVGGIGGAGARAGDVSVASIGQTITQGQRSHGVIAQSIGGSGGTGGFAVSGALSIGGQNSAAIGVAIGNSGGGGGLAGDVSVRREGFTQLAGDDSSGVHAQSIGGSGGAGGFSLAGSISFSGQNAASVGVAIGGSGGTAASARNVTVSNVGDMIIAGNRSHAVLAQSLGGGGGNGGFSGTLAAAAATGKVLSVGVGIGGSGAGGGSSRNVAINSSGNLTTLGVDSDVLLAQSIGGGGGSGGSVFSMGLGIGMSSLAASVGIGGSGDFGGSAGEVSVIHSGNIVSVKERSRGIVAQSIGGGGGNGGFSAALAGGLAQDTAMLASVGIGGTGAGGGEGNIVTVSADGSVTTQGDDSDGILAQSIGGGGGNGGFALTGAAAFTTGGAGRAAGVAIGGGGGTASNGREVTIIGNANISTLGDRARGIVAQSIGGGGGNGGWSSAIAAAASSSSEATGAAVSVGGFAGAGGNASAVTIDVTGDVTTEGLDATGILAQSIGGGGGNGGFSLAGTVNAGQNLKSANVSIGGGGGAGGDASAVSLTSGGQVWTQGDRAAALVAQSIGGGGGNGGGSVAAGLDIGLGGSGKGYAASVAIGGTGGVAGNAARVDLTSLNTVLTNGEDSYAIVAQSIGGGGGNGGFAIAGQAAVNAPLTGAALGLGGAGGGGGDAGSVTVRVEEGVASTGARSGAILAQSIGGGGGSGGFSASIVGGLELGAGTSGASKTASLSIGGSGGVGGDASSVSVTSLVAAQTQGEFAHAITAQSIGGGGGSGGASISADLSRSTGATSIAFALGGQGGAAGDADNVTVNVSGLISTEGENSYGILAQSIGGGGGDGGMAGALAFNSAATPGSNKKPINISMALGGGAGIGGIGADVSIDSLAQIFTMGEGSNGMLVQSIGGSGGAGGMAFAGSISDSTATNLALSFGGVGGMGNVGGAIDIASRGSIVTQGNNAVGILAQSIGGGGGAGGSVGALAMSVTKPNATGTTTNLTMELGGAGGDGNIGGTVTVLNEGTIDTLGELSHGIFAESIGGGGGSGGATGVDFELFNGYVEGGIPNGSLSTGNNATNISVALGADGGIGLDGGAVTVTNRGDIVTRGLQANAIFAQSIGGGGGQAGLAQSVAASLAITGGAGGANNKTKQMAVAIGGKGGTAGDAGAVTVSNSAILLTLADSSFGILAQSIGGGGGNGGDASGLATVYNRKVTKKQEKRLEKKNTAISVAIGGEGGAAGDGNTVTVTNSGTIETLGSGSHAVFAQSIGGGGGNGGAVSGPVDDTLDLLDASNKGAAREFSVGVGGGGAASGSGGDLLVSNTGLLVARGDLSYGVFAQSVGGGGGTGGEGGDADVSIGGGWAGTGGSSGDGGAITFNNAGTIVTEGFVSHGVFLQSIGGGGGTGGATGGPEETDPDDEEIIESAGGLVTLPGDFAQAAQEPPAGPNMSVGIGGQGGSSGNGGAISAVNDGNIWTTGDGSMGMLVQSVGGGGGVGGNAGGGALNVGGQGGAAGDGGDIDIVNNGQIATEGKLATGIYAQSVGGGGGIGGSVGIESSQLPALGSGGTREQIAAGLAAGNSLPSVAGQLATVGAPYQIQSVSLAGEGGAAGDGGNVTITNNGSIFTKGTLAFGIFAQSVGGGGGMGGAGSLTPSEIAIPMSGGRGGHGGDVTVIHTGDIVTEGFGAIGIFAQSVGGGGGYAGDLSFGVGDFSTPAIPLPIGAQGGDGGDVTVTSTGNIHVSGVGAVAIFAQSVGGGGGLWNGQGILGTAGSLGLKGEAGKVSWLHTGDLVATDINGIAALFQSQGTDGQDDIIATLDGDIRGGSVFGKGIMVEGGENNLLTLFGSVASESGLAIEATAGNDTINSQSMVFGNIDLFGGDTAQTSSLRRAAELRTGASSHSTEVNIYNNLSDGMLVAYDFIDLGEAGILNNLGMLAFGEANDRRDVTLTGSLVQGGAGIFLSDLDFSQSGQQTDSLMISGNADLSGEVILQLNNVSELRTGSFSSVLIDAAGGLSDNGVTLRGFEPSAVARFGLNFTPTQMTLDHTIDFTGLNGGLNINQTSFGEYLNRAVNAGSNNSVQDLAVALLFVPEIAQIAATYDTISGTVYADNVADMTSAGEQFSRSMFDCVQVSNIASSNGCAWGVYSDRDTKLAATTQNLRADARSERIAGGFELGIGGGWTFGFSAARDWTDLAAQSAASSGERTFVGGHIGARIGELETQIFAIYGEASNDLSRIIAYPGSISSATGNQDLSLIEFGGRVSTLIEDGEVFLRPSFQLSYVSINGSYSAENGDSGLRLAQTDAGSSFLRAAAGAKVGSSISLGGKATLRSHLFTRMTFDSTDNQSALLRFTDVPDIVDFTQLRFTDQLRAEVGAGLSLEFNNIALQAGWDSSIGGHAQFDEIRIGASFRF